MRTSDGKRQACCCVAVALAAAALVAKGDAMKLENYWSVDGERMTFSGGGLAVEARLPHGFESLMIGGNEFLKGGEGFGGIAFRKPGGAWVSTFTSLDNISHDARQGRKGAVADGVYMLSCITGWSLPRFELYAGFNDTADHDVVLFFGDGVRALRVAASGQSVAMTRQMVTRASKPGTKQPCKEIAVVHEAGVVLRIGIASGLSAELLTAPDGTARLAVVIPCKGMAANSITCEIDVHNGSDALTVFPRFAVSSPTMGQSDPGYKPQSNGPWALYEKGAKLDYEIVFDWLGSKPFAGQAVVHARHALGRGKPLLFSAAPAKTAEKDGVTTYRAVLHPEFVEPGVSEVNVFLNDAAGVVLMTERLRILYDWPAYKPVFLTPPDINAFWDETLAELKAVPLEPKIEAELFKDDPEWQFQHVSFSGWQGKRIHACLYIPKHASRPLPVTISAHPGALGFGVNHRPDGVYGSKINNDPRFVTIIPLIRGFEPDAKEVPFNQPWWGPLDTRDDYVARSWYCALVRALDYLATRPELADMSRVVAKGGSQGGALALVTAALDPRVKVCIADCPSNCMHHDVLTPGTYQTFGPTAGQVPPGQTLDDLKRTLSYYDPAHLAPRIACPTVIHANVGDLTVHSMGGLGVYNNLTGLKAGQKWFLPGVNGHFHAGSVAGGKKAKELIDALVGVKAE